MRPEEFEPSLFGLKDRCAAVTPRPRVGRGYPFQTMQLDHVSLDEFSIEVAREGVEPSSPPYQDGVLNR